MEKKRNDLYMKLCMLFELYDHYYYYWLGDEEAHKNCSTPNKNCIILVITEMRAIFFQLDNNK